MLYICITTWESPKGLEIKWKKFGKYVDFIEAIEYQIIQCTILAHTLSTRLDYVMTDIKKMK